MVNITKLVFTYPIILSALAYHKILALHDQIFTVIVLIFLCHRVKVKIKSVLRKNKLGKRFYFV